MGISKVALATWTMLAFAAGCDNGDGLEDDEPACSPIVKFSNPVGVSPQAVDGVVTLTARVECAQDLSVWAWTESGDDVTLALDVYEQEGGGAVEVLVPVDEGDVIEGCGSSLITAAIVDDRGDVVDMDRTHVKYGIDG